MAHSSIEAAKKTCRYGHPFDAENTYLTTQGWRQCRTCRRSYAPLTGPVLSKRRRKAKIVQFTHKDLDTIRSAFRAHFEKKRLNYLAEHELEKVL